MLWGFLGGCIGLVRLLRRVVRGNGIDAGRESLSVRQVMRREGRKGKALEKQVIPYCTIEMIPTLASTVWLA